MPGQDELKDAARADLCRLLAACYYQPGSEFAEERVFDAMVEAAARIHPELADRARLLREAFSAASLEALLVDYTRLFLGPVQPIAQPYGSVWLGADNSLMRDSTMAVLALYAEGGFDMSEDFRELPDHIAAELEFLYLLLFKEAQAARSGLPTAVVPIASLRQRFLREHLGAWVGPFTAAVAAGAQTSFYRELAQLTDRFVRRESGASRS